MFVTSPLALLVVLTIYEFGIVSSTIDADYKSMYDYGVGKRAYTYSANKRPQYDFGIGKRSPDSSRQKMYSFGLGKRLFNDNSNYDDYTDDEILHDDYNKRIKPYEFGLGKRAAPAPYSFGLGKRGSGQGKLYSFGLGKRSLPSEFSGISSRSQKYNFGIGKRDVNDDLNDFLASLNDNRDHNIYTRANQRYNFGVGKRALSNEFTGLSPRSQRYNFGIGKRDVSENKNDFFNSIDDDNHNVYTRASQKYNFGLGKRSLSLDSSDDEVNNIYDMQQADSGLIKKSRYDFGLGKRNSEDYNEMMQLVDSINRETRAKQRYSFGLGKREVSKEELEQLEDEISPTSSVLLTQSLKGFDDINNKNPSQQLSRKREIANKIDKQEHQIASLKH